jgi:Amidohydrolase family
MKSALVAVLLTSSLLWAAQRPKPASVIIITNANIVDVRYGAVMPNATIIIKNGVIEAVAKIATIDTGHNVRVVNAGGQYVIPGLWDMNAHFSAASSDRQSVYSSYLSNGVIGLREPGKGDDRIQLVSGIALKGPHDSLGEILPYLHTAFPAPTLPEQRTIEGVDEVLLACSSKEDELRKKRATPGPQEERDPMDPPAVPIAKEIRATYDPQKAQDLFVRISTHQTWMVPALVSLEAPLSKFSNDDWESLSDPFSIKYSRDEIGALMEEKAEFERARLLVHDMRESGVQFLAGTNGPRENVHPGRSLHRELELLVKSGLSPLDAIRSATFNAALYIAKLNKYGVIEPGHAADLVLLDGNPGEDITQLEKITGVVIDGKYFSRADLDALTGPNPKPPRGPKTASVPVPQSEQ